MVYDNVKSLCDKRNLSIYQLEKELQFANGTISKWRESSPTVDKLQKVAIFFAVPLEYFLKSDKN